MTSIAVEHKQSVRVAAAPDFVFEVLADVPRSVSHFPKLEQLVPIGGSRYRWEMEPMGTAGISHQVVYACDYAADRVAGTVHWTPVRGVGNGVIQGHWRLREAGAGTALDFHTHGTLDVPVPRLLKAMAGPFVSGEFARSVEHYIAALSQTFGGRVG